MENILELREVQKDYRIRGQQNVLPVLRGVNLRVAPGEFVVIMGESGSGKTTLLNMVATLDQPSAGQILYEGSDISRLNNSELSTFRRQKLGFVFQDYNLLDQFDIADNIRLPMILERMESGERERRLQHFMRALRIENKADKYPYQLSGGERQRVAIARALVMQPLLLLADEPTGALDSRNADHLLELFEGLNNSGQTILMVTHSIRAAAHGKRALFLKDGRIYYELYRGKQSVSEFREKIAEAMALLDRQGV
ncbi:MAG: ABC transporter ATP-binding protein [Eubacteriales bacterium]|nr:ABC transporter ATP-binding protein [Eubacteriales bacterium]